jgi:hypothetical protein
VSVDFKNGQLLIVISDEITVYDDINSMTGYNLFRDDVILVLSATPQIASRDNEKMFPVLSHKGP